MRLQGSSTFAALELLIIASLVLPFSGCAEFDPAILETVLGDTAQAPLDEATVTRGLLEALRIGTDRAVDSTSRIDGFLANELIRIHLPDEFEEVADIARKIGFSRQVDELEIGMNRAAEKAVGEAREVFFETISQMTIEDAFGVLRGGESAATDYLHTRTATQLEERFQPIIITAMKQVEIYRLYGQITAAYDRLPGTRKPALDLDEYLTTKALDGLFTTLGQEERRIREEPIARTTELLRRVFGRRS